MDNSLPGGLDGIGPASDELVCVRVNYPFGAGMGRFFDRVGAGFYCFDQISVTDKPDAGPLISICAVRMDKRGQFDKTAVGGDGVGASHIGFLPQPHSRQMLEKVTVKSGDLVVLPMQEQAGNDNDDQQSDYGGFFQGWCLGFVK